MNLFKKLGFVTDDAQEQEPKKPVKKTEMVPASRPASSPIVGDVNYLDIIDQKIRAANQPGPDYLEFVDSMKKLEGKVGEQQKFENVFVVFETQGVTANKLVDSAQGYIRVIETEEKHFANEHQSRTQSDVDVPLNEAKKLEIENKQLQEKLQQNLNKIGELNAKAQAARDKLTTAEGAFISAAETAKALINDNIVKMQKYLPHAINK